MGQRGAISRNHVANLYLAMPIKTIARYRRLVVVFIAVAIIQFLELVLLHYKYGIFTGGFLQPFAYTSTAERLGFIAVSLWFD